MGDNAVYCQQRKLRMQFNVPITRYTPISPYTNTNLTAFDLDMRRKAEILKHTGSQKSTQGNKLTKAQLFAQVVRGFSPTQKLLNKRTGVYNPAALEFCDSSLNLVLTSSSDVPGPIRALYLDKDIPLYHFATPNDAYTDNVKDERTGFQFYPNPVVPVFPSTLSQSVGALEIFATIPDTVTKFTLTIPFTGEIISSGPVSLNVTYGGSPVLKSPFVSFVSAGGIITIRDIVLFTATGYIFELFITCGSAIVVNPDEITISA
jgi:hypothetical protein